MVISTLHPIKVNFLSDDSDTTLLTGDGGSFYLPKNDFGEVIGARLVDNIYVIFFDGEGYKRLNNISGFSNTGEILWTLSAPQVGTGAPAPWGGLATHHISGKLFFDNGFGWAWPLENSKTGELGTKFFIK